MARFPDVGVPRIGVMSVGVLLNTAKPLPVSSVMALARLADEGVASHVATPVPRPVMEPTAGVIVVLLTAVPRPFPFTVMTALCVADPNVPTFELTVASVSATGPGPEAVPSPVSAVT